MENMVLFCLVPCPLAGDKPIQLISVSYYPVNCRIQQGRAGSITSASTEGLESGLWKNVDRFRFYGGCYNIQLFIILRQQAEKF